MKKTILLLCFLISGTSAFAQLFSQYNTGTLYDSFEHPAQRSFIPDSSRAVASNFFFPTFNFNAYLTGNAQAALKNRIFTGAYNNSSLVVGQGKLNHLNTNLNLYSIMVKVFTNLDGDQEMGISLQTKVEGRGTFTDESVQLFSDYTKFTNNSYSNIFNDNGYEQSYHQLSFTYREKVNKKLAIGFKVSALSGIAYNEVNITRSNITYDKAEDVANLSMAGTYYSSYKPDAFDKSTLIPNFVKNPGAAISIGTSYRSDHGVIIQWNLKDLGFIHWRDGSEEGTFDGSGTIHELSGRKREDSIYKVINKITTASLTHQSFNTPLDGKLEFAASKSFPLNYDNSLKYSPTFVVSKDLFYSGVTGAIVNHLQYKNVTATVTGSYNDLNVFSLGGQFMIKGPNSEFFIGSERLLQSVTATQAALKNYTALDKSGQYTGADFFIGASFKFGYLIEHPANASHIPMPGTESKGFIGRLWDRLFAKKGGDL